MQLFDDFRPSLVIIDFVSTFKRKKNVHTLKIIGYKKNNILVNIK